MKNTKYSTGKTIVLLPKLFTLLSTEHVNKHTLHNKQKCQKLFMNVYNKIVV